MTERRSYLEERLIGVARLEPKIVAIWAYTRGTPFDLIDPYEVFTFYVFDDHDITNGDIETLKVKTTNFYQSYLMPLASHMRAAGTLHFSAVKYEEQFKIPKQAEQIWARHLDKRASMLDEGSVDGQ